MIPLSKVHTHYSTKKVHPSKRWISPKKMTRIAKLHLKKRSYTVAEWEAKFQPASTKRKEKQKAIRNWRHSTRYAPWRVDYFTKPFVHYDKLKTLFYEPDMAADVMGLSAPQFALLCKRGIIPFIDERGYTQSQLCFLAYASFQFRVKQVGKYTVQFLEQEFDLERMGKFLAENWENSFRQWIRREMKWQEKP